MQDLLVPAIDVYSRDKPQVEREVGMRSCGLLGMTIMLMAREPGYQRRPMDGFDFYAVAGILNLPEDHTIAFMIAIGKGTRESWPKPAQLPLDEVMVNNRFIDG